MTSSIQFTCTRCEDYWTLGRNMFGNIEEPPIHHCPYCDGTYCDNCYNLENNTCNSCKEK